MRRSRLAAARAGHVRKRGQPHGRQRNVGSPRGPHLMVSTSMVYGCIIDVFNTEDISAECLRDKVLPALPGLLRCRPLGNHAKLNWCPRTCKEARCALRAASLFASCGLFWEIAQTAPAGVLCSHPLGGTLLIIWMSRLLTCAVTVFPLLLGYALFVCKRMTC